MTIYRGGKKRGFGRRVNHATARVELSDGYVYYTYIYNNNIIILYIVYIHI